LILGIYFHVPTITLMTHSFKSKLFNLQIFVYFLYFLVSDFNFLTFVRTCFMS
jgi:hypothetical protein